MNILNCVEENDDYWNICNKRKIQWIVKSVKLILKKYDQFG